MPNVRSCPVLTVWLLRAVDSAETPLLPAVNPSGSMGARFSSSEGGSGVVVGVSVVISVGSGVVVGLGVLERKKKNQATPPIISKSTTMRIIILRADPPLRWLGIETGGGADMRAGDVPLGVVGWVGGLGKGVPATENPADCGAEIGGGSGVAGRGGALPRSSCIVRTDDLG